MSFPFSPLLRKIYQAVFLELPLTSHGLSLLGAKENQHLFNTTTIHKMCFAYSLIARARYWNWAEPCRVFPGTSLTPVSIPLVYRKALASSALPEFQKANLFREVKKFPGGSGGKNSPASAGDIRDTSLALGWEDPLEEAMTTHSCLENPMDRGTWWAIVHRVAKSWSWLKWPSMHAHEKIQKWRKIVK